ncbi:MAG: SDR family oxidoreductase [Boseongicola sp. SB0662_bin_57]|nr:SDR family oxidoreductase [Boseongicola sp. SB0662_bin_57]
MSANLKDRIAIVTGGAQGIGLAIARSLHEAGARVVIGDIQPPADGTIANHELDATEEASVAAFFAHVCQSLGRPSVLVNNAGILYSAPLDRLTVSEWDNVMAVNLRGPFLMARQFASCCAARDKPAIINISSIEAFSGNPDHTAYMTSKAGINGLTVSLAIDLGHRGVRVNAIAPGWISTEMNEGYMARVPDRAKAERQLCDLHPLGRTGSPSDIGDVAVWLASDQSRFVTGQVIRVEGGRLARLSLPAAFND